MQILWHPNWRSPTIKHHCPKTNLAACLRACSNNVGPDPKVQEDFTKWFRTVKIPQFMKALSKEHLVVDLDDWLKKYPIKYREKIRIFVDTSIMQGETSTFEAFPKIEMQFTELGHDEKFSILNDVKERQINAPPDEKKFLANAFINLLEGIAHRHFPSYCGRKNWLEICDSIEKGTYKFNDPIFGAADGSGFDMTQLTWQHMLFNELMKACANHPNVTWLDPMNIEGFLRAIKESLLLKVNSDGIKYTTQGRASGDGWTTLGNTILMSSYWEYTFFKFGFTEEDYFLMVKGDDVLFAFEAVHHDRFNKFWPTIFATSKIRQDFGLGQICTKILFGDITEMDFLSNHFFYNAMGRLRMTRIPARVIQTTSWSTKVPKNISKTTLSGQLKRIKVARNLCYSKGMCLLAWAKGLPIFQTLGETLVRLGKAGKHHDFNEHSDTYRVWHDVDDSQEYLFYLWQRFKISASDVESIELKLRSINSLHGIIDIPEFEKFYC